ncbi:MAG: SDR family oxidoreductase, partial [Chitinophagaceae bacterium]
IMTNIKILITGGAGFIGSNLVEKYMTDDRIALVRVIDDLSNGYYENIQEFENNPKFEFIKADICNYEACIAATKNINKVSHQAALGSVPRSVENPMRTTEVNILGTVNILHACVVNKVERIVLACSSSTYGDSKELPKVEDNIGKPLSPYAITKFAVELYADVFQKTYGLNYVALRYFNVFGPKQNPDNPYAAVIPIFCKAFLENKPATIFGDGETSRDFTYIANALQANDLALFTENNDALNQVYNVACGEQTTLNEMVEMLRQISNNNMNAQYANERKGDVKHSEANIDKAKNLLQYHPDILFKAGLEKIYQWYQSEYSNG